MASLVISNLRPMFRVSDKSEGHPGQRTDNTWCGVDKGVRSTINGTPDVPKKPTTSPTLPTFLFNNRSLLFVPFAPHHVFSVHF